MPHGELTHEAYKALRLQLDPDDDEAEQRIRDALDARTEHEIQKALNEWQREIAERLHPNMTPAEIESLIQQAGVPQVLRDAIQRGLIDASDLGINVAFDKLGRIGLGFDYTIANTAAREWARQYVFDLVRGIESTTQNGLREAVSRWIDSGESLPALVRDIQPMFTRQRAKLIAQTETTRAYAEAERRTYQSIDEVSGLEWRTARDERVCPTCGMLHGRRVPKNSDFDGYFPPAHPGCRCWVSPVVGGM